MIGSKDSDVLTGGNASDRFVFRDIGDARDRITDFEVGERGDVLDLTRLFVGFDPARDKLNNFLRFRLANGDTIVRVDPDGGVNNFTGIAVLKGVSVTVSELLAQGNLIIG